MFKRAYLLIAVVSFSVIAMAAEETTVVSKSISPTSQGALISSPFSMSLGYEYASSEIAIPGVPIFQGSAHQIRLIGDYSGWTQFPIQLAVPYVKTYMSISIGKVTLSGDQSFLGRIELGTSPSIQTSLGHLTIPVRIFLPTRQESNMTRQIKGGSLDETEEIETDESLFSFRPQGADNHVSLLAGVEDEITLNSNIPFSLVGGLSYQYNFAKSLPDNVLWDLGDEIIARLGVKTSLVPSTLSSLGLEYSYLTPLKWIENGQKVLEDEGGLNQGFTTVRLLAKTSWAFVKNMSLDFSGSAALYDEEYQNVKVRRLFLPIEDQSAFSMHVGLTVGLI